MAPRTLATLHAAHSWLGALIGCALFAICYSGCWALARDELDAWEVRARRLPPVAHVDLDAARRSLQRAGAGDGDFVFTLPAGARRVLLAQGRPGAVFALDPADGALIDDAAPGMAALLVALHRGFYAGFPGRIAISLFGAGMFVLVVCGVAMRARSWRAFLAWRKGTPAKRRLVEAHALAGAWLSPWLALIAVTGLFSGFGALGTIALARFAYPGGLPAALGDLTRGGEKLAAPAAVSGSSAAWSANVLLDRHLAAEPSLHPETIALRGWEGPGAEFVVAGTRAGRLGTALFESNRYRASDGALLGERSAAGRGAWVEAFVAVQPLHFARYGGAIGRGLHLLAGFVAAFLALSGTLAWLRRREAQGRSAGIPRAAVAGVCGGLLGASALLLLATALLPAAGPSRTSVQATVFGAGWLVLAVLPLHRWSRRNALRRAAVIAGGSALAAVAVDLARSAGETWGAFAPAARVDAVVGALGMALCASAFRFREVPHEG